MPQRGRHNADEAILMALACGATIEAAAAKAGVSQATVYRRLADPEFQARLREVRADMVTRTAAMLSASAMEAVKTLLALQAAGTPAAVRLGAAKAIIDLGAKLREVADLEERIAALERAAEHSSPGNTGHLAFRR